jgi:L-ribulose-5-phosphate 4-epimerase
MNNEGYIKFNLEHSIQPIDMPDGVYQQLSFWRTRLFDLGLIGETPDGIGFGNISIKKDEGFFITGSATGSHRELKTNGYARVVDYDFKANKVVSKGLSRASSESMSHAAVYEGNGNIGAVVHVHSASIWEKYLNILPSTPAHVAFGTPEMAFAIMELLAVNSHFEKGVVIMGGHQDGIIAFGQNLDMAGRRILKLVD